MSDFRTLRTTPMPLARNRFRGFNFCNRLHCKYCPLLDKSGEIKNHESEKFLTMKNISCRSSNVIYAITCIRCNKQYVGQTMLHIKDRFIHHFRDIEVNNNDKSVSRHFNSHHIRFQRHENTCPGVYSQTSTIHTGQFHQK